MKTCHRLCVQYFLYWSCWRFGLLARCFSNEFYIFRKIVVITFPSVLVRCHCSNYRDYDLSDENQRIYISMCANNINPFFTRNDFSSPSVEFTGIWKTEQPATDESVPPRLYIALLSWNTSRLRWVCTACVLRACYVWERLCQWRMRRGAVIRGESEQPLLLD